MAEKTTLEEFKKSGDTYAQLAKETLEHSEKTDTVITLLGAICDVIDANLNVNKDNSEIVGGIVTTVKAIAGLFL